MPLRATLALLLLAAPSGVEASVNVGQLFVEATEPSEAAAQVKLHLEELEKAAPGSQVGREVVVLRGGRWTPVVDNRSGGADPHLARALAEGLDTRVVRIEVAGASLTWRYQILKGPEVLETGGHPVAGFESNWSEDSMPRYRDVEVLAWKWLAGRRVPAAHRFVGIGELEKSGEAEGVAGLALAVKASPQGAQVVRQEVRVRLPKRGKRPPTPMDTRLPRAGQPRGQGVDLVQLQGRPDAAAVGHLAKLLVAIQKRHRQADPTPFCHIVPDGYREAVYERMTQTPGPCRATYRELLERARGEKEEGLPTRRIGHQKPTDTEKTE